MAKQSNTKSTRYSRAEALQKGLKKHYAKTAKISLNGKDYTPNELIALLQTTVDTGQKSDTDRATLRESVAAEREARQTAQPALVGLPSFLYLAHGNASSVLADFGLPPRTRKKPKVKVKAAAADKAAATRNANKPATKAGSGAPAGAAAPTKASS